MEKKDVKKVHKALNDYLEQFDLAPIYSVEEVAHWFLPREDVVSSFVVEVRVLNDGYFHVLIETFVCLNSRATRRLERAACGASLAITRCLQP